MENMQCNECVLKHLSKALSYGKEVMSGHGKGSALDHRPDLLGEIGNAEDHLKLINDDLFAKVKEFRTELQKNQVAVTMDTLQTIRKFYAEVEHLAYGTSFSSPKVQKIEDTPDVFFFSVTNLEWFKFAFESLSRLGNYNKVYYMASIVDLSAFSIEKAEFDSLKENVILWNENTALLKNMDAREFPRIKDSKAGFDYTQIYSALKSGKPAYYYEAFPMLIKKSKFLPLKDEKYPLTAYGNLYPDEREYRAYDVAVSLDKQICCSSRSRIKNSLFFRYENEVAFASGKAELTKA